MHTGFAKMPYSLVICSCSLQRRPNTSGTMHQSHCRTKKTKMDPHLVKSLESFNEWEEYVGTKATAVMQKVVQGLPEALHV